MAESQQLTLILEENGQSRAYRLSADSVTIGRTADNAVRVSDALSSRQHCQVERGQGTVDGADITDIEVWCDPLLFFRGDDGTVQPDSFCLVAV